jgi:hypothetical protein
MRRLVRKHSSLMTVRVGDARGLDLLVAQEATRWGIWPQQEVCHWPPAGATRQERWLAAHERNERVIGGSVKNPGQADRLVAFFAPGKRSPGTSDCITIARERGLPVDVYHEGRWTQEGPP